MNPGMHPGADTGATDDDELRDVGDLPDALDHYDSILAAIGDRTPVVFLDYDGTLAPIARTPEAATLPRATRATIERLRTKVPVAIVSGRDRADVTRMVGVGGLVVAGSHGFDLAGPGWEHVHPDGRVAAAALGRAADELDLALADVPGLLVERKAFAVAVHVRRVDEAEHERIDEVVARIATADPHLRRTAGKLVWELRPSAPWDKGRAVRYLCDRLGIDDTDHVSLYIGDDVTDEDALAVVASDGIGIVVSTEHRPTAARFRLDDPAAVAVFLERLAEDR